MGLGLGANDAANLFGPGVAAKTIKYRTATYLIAIFVLLGAVLEGPKCMTTLGKLAGATTLNEAFVILCGAAFSVMIMTFFGIPVSTSQAVVGSILGSIIFKHLSGIPGDLSGAFSDLPKIMICWVGTPIGSAILAFIMYYLVEFLLERIFKNIIYINMFIKWSLIIGGCYGAYGLGANNVANTTAVYVSSGFLSPQKAALYGGLAIGSGALLFSKNVMTTVGKKISAVGPLGALIATIAHSITIHFYTQIGVPVSSSQAIVGAVIGIGLIKGTKNISYKKIQQIVAGWILTPIGAGLFSMLLIYILTYFKMSVYQ